MPFREAVLITSTTVETVTLEVKAVTMEFGDNQQNGRVTVLLGAKDAAGNWRADVQIQPFRADDDPANPVPSRRNVATLLHRLILSGKIDGSSPLAQRFNVANSTPMSEALAQIVWTLMNA
jgi:hypothetical protein